MSKVQIQKGKYLDLTAPAGGVVSGSPYLIGGLVVIAQVSAEAATEFSGKSEGVHAMPKASGVALSEGDIAYWDDASSEVNATGAGFYPCGTVVSAATSGDSSVAVKLLGYATESV